MIRRLLTFVSAVSLLSAVLTVVLWVRSHGGSGDELGFIPPGRAHQHWVDAHDGSLYWRRSIDRPRGPDDPAQPLWLFLAPPGGWEPEPGWTRGGQLGFALFAPAADATEQYAVVARAPMWAVLAATLPLPVWRGWVKWRRRGQAREPAARRLRRAAARAVVAAGAATALTAVACWGLSYVYMHWTTVHLIPQNLYDLTSVDGTLAVESKPAQGGELYLTTIARPSRPEDRNPDRRAFPGFDYTEEWEQDGLFGNGAPTRLWSRTWVVPYWSIVAATAWLPVLVLGRRWGQSRRRRQWAAGNRCETCGYDLRGTPGRCPECGAAAPVDARPV